MLSSSDTYHRKNTGRSWTKTIKNGALEMLEIDQSQDRNWMPLGTENLHPYFMSDFGKNFDPLARNVQHLITYWMHASHQEFSELIWHFSCIPSFILENEIVNMADVVS